MKPYNPYDPFDYYYHRPVYYRPYPWFWKGDILTDKNCKVVKPKKVLLSAEEQKRVADRRAEEALNKQGYEVFKALRSVNPGMAEVKYLDYLGDTGRLWTTAEVLKVVKYVVEEQDLSPFFYIASVSGLLALVGVCVLMLKVF